MLSLYATALIIALGFATLLIFRAFGTQKYKSFFDQWLWSVNDENN